MATLKELATPEFLKPMLKEMDKRKTAGKVTEALNARRSAKAELSDDELAAQAREEARSGGTDAPATADMKQKMADRKAEKAAESAPTTKTEMGKPFKSGGVTRADGCISKGHTRGKMV
jgi:hypothetical protein